MKKIIITFLIVCNAYAMETPHTTTKGTRFTDNIVWIDENGEHRLFDCEKAQEKQQEYNNSFRFPTFEEAERMSIALYVEDLNDGYAALEDLPATYNNFWITASEDNLKVFCPTDLKMRSPTRGETCCLRLVNRDRDSIALIAIDWERVERFATSVWSKCPSLQNIFYAASIAYFCYNGYCLYGPNVATKAIVAQKGVFGKIIESTSIIWTALINAKLVWGCPNGPE